MALLACGSECRDNWRGKQIEVIFVQVMPQRNYTFPVAIVRVILSHQIFVFFLVSSHAAIPMGKKKLPATTGT